MKTIKIVLTLLGIMLSTLVFSQERENNVSWNELYCPSGIINVGQYAHVILVKRNVTKIPESRFQDAKAPTKIPKYSNVKVSYDSIVSIKADKFSSISIQDGLRDVPAVIEIGDYSSLKIKDKVSIPQLTVKAGRFSNVHIFSLNTKKAIIKAGSFSNISLSGKTDDLNIDEGRNVNVRSDVKYTNLVENSGIYYKKRDYNEQEKVEDAIENAQDAIDQAQDMEESDDFINDKNNNAVVRSFTKAILRKHRRFDSYAKIGYSFLGWSGKVGGIDDLFSGPDNQYSLKHSTRWQIDVYDFSYYLADRFYISSGIGYESNIFRFSKNVNWAEKQDIFADNSVSSSSKLVARYVTVPLIFGWDCFGYNKGVQLGVITGANFRTSHTGFKRKYDNGKEKVSYKSGTAYNNFKPLKADLYFGLHFSEVDVYMRYALTSMFKNNKEMTLYPYSVGVAFNIGY